MPVRALWPVAALILAGCTVGPDYHPPETPVPPAFSEPQPTGAEVDVAAWWRVFGDPTLDDLVARALKDNPDIGVAASRVRQARLQEIIAGAANKPTLDATAGVTHIELSRNAGFSSLIQRFSGGGAGGTGAGGGGAGGAMGGSNQAPAGVTTPGSGITTFSLGLDASWELDLFGGGRRQVEVARARGEAELWNGRDAAVTLASEVATTYFTLRFDQLRIAVIGEELARQRGALGIAEKQARVGLVPQTDFIRQRGSITATEARLAPIRADIEVQIHALGLLLGQPPATFVSLKARLPMLPAAPAIPAGLPSDLLRRRPDIRAAERQLAATNADIGVTVADLYPKFTLTGLEQLISSTLRTLFAGDSLQLTGSAQAMFPLIDFGRRNANVGVRREDRQQAYLMYQKTVLSAIRDVEDPLARIAAERQRHATLEAALRDRQASARAIEAQYRTGFVAQDALLNAEADVLGARENLAQSDDQLRRITVALFKALGGGWEAADPALLADEP